MRIKAYIPMTLVLIAAFGVGGFADTVGATPKESQRLRGLGGRTFEVMVTELPAGEPFANCYIFLADGTWIDPPFGAPGTWVQHSNGASTTYTAEARLLIPNFGIDLQLIQNGMVTPARGKGTLQLEATTTVTGFLFGLPFDATFLSVGMQNNDCSVDTT